MKILLIRTSSAENTIFKNIYNEQEVDEMILLIRDSFIPAFVGLEKTLRSKLEEVKNDWE